jgi:hypothetical protein
MIVTSLIEVGKPVPIKVTVSPPFTVPNLGEIAVRFGVAAESYVTAFVRAVVVPLSLTVGVQS